MTTFPDTGSGFAQMLLGLPVYLSNEYNRGYFYFRQTELGMYVNDKIKISPRLTLNLGLRWDYWTPYSEARNRLVLPYEPDQKFEVITPGNVTMSQLNAPPAQLAAFSSIGLTWATANSVGYPSALFVEPHHDFGPRLGAAYQINHNTVLRGSYGVYYVPDPLAFLLEALRINVPLNFNYSNDAVMNTNVPGGANGPYMYEYPYISAPAASDYLPAKTVTINSADAAPTEGNSAVSWDGKNWRDSHVQTWNLTLEHELPMHTGLRLSYIGTYGGSLEQQYALNDPEPDYNYAVRTGLQPPSDSNQLRGVPQWNGYNTNHTGYSRDHSFQAEVHRTFSNGASFQAFYAFTRQLTTTDPNGFTDGNTSLNGGGGGATVPESFEVMGEPNLTYAQRAKLIYLNGTSVPPHRVTFNGIYSLPFGKGKYFARSASTPLNYLIGGWQIATIGTWNSGYWMGVNAKLVQPGSVRIPAGKRATLNISGSSDHYRQWFAGAFDASTATNVSGTIAPAVARQAGPNCSGNYIGQLAVNLADGTCYNAPFSQMYNSAPRDNIIGPGAWNDDFSLYKHFKIGEKVDMRFAADAFNFTNHPTDVNPNSTTGLQDLSLQANGSRQIQLSLRVEF